MDRKLDEFAKYIEDWIWETDENSVFTYSSPQSEEILGYTPKEIVGMSPYDLMPPHEIERSRETFSGFLNNTKSFSQLNDYLTHKNGSLILLEVSGRPYFSSDGSFQGYRGISRRIDGRDEDSLEKQTYKSMLDSLSEATVSTDADGEIVYANKVFFCLFGYTEKEIYGKHISCLDSLEERSIQSTAESMRMLREHGSISVVSTRRKKDGQLIKVLIRATAIKDQNGQIVRLVGSYTDLTHLESLKESLSETSSELYQAVTELEEKQFELEAAQRIAKLGSWTLDVDSGEVFWTKELHRMMGTNPSFSPPNFSDHSKLFTPKSWAKLTDAINQAIEKGLTYDIELQLLREGQDNFWIRAVGEPRKSNEGKVTGLRGIALDITDKKRAELRIEQTLEDLHNALDGSVELAMTIGEVKDPYTAGHEQRVASLAVAIGEKLNLDWKTLLGLKYVGQLHDIGKIKIPSELLAKPGKISGTEFELIKEHTTVGWEILQTLDLPWPAAEVALQHHERMDGSGYPNGLKGEDICLEARIIAVADVMEAMTTHRPYRPGLGVFKALEEIRSGRDSKYDPEVVDACLALFEEGYSLPAADVH